jgi:hypothetical protein
MLKSFLLLFAILNLSSCASVFSQPDYNVDINSSPPKANFKIINKSGTEIYSGTTPASVSLSSGDGYFSKAKYSIQFEKLGYAEKNYELNPTIDNWYFANIPFLNIPGLLIVDPANGAMYELPDNVNVLLDELSIDTK